MRPRMLFFPYYLLCSSLKANWLIMSRGVCLFNQPYLVSVQICPGQEDRRRRELDPGTSCTVYSRGEHLITCLCTQYTRLLIPPHTFLSCTPRSPALTSPTPSLPSSSPWKSLSLTLWNCLSFKITSRRRDSGALMAS